MCERACDRVGQVRGTFIQEVASCGGEFWWIFQDFYFYRILMGTHVCLLLRSKLARIRFARQSRQTGQTGYENQSDRFERYCQITNCTATLCISCRDKQNTYIERPIWSSDKEVMPPGRLASRSGRSDRSEQSNPS